MKIFTHKTSITHTKSPNIYTDEKNNYSIKTSIEDMILKLVPNGIKDRKFHLSWITKDVIKQMKSRDKLNIKAIKSAPPGLEKILKYKVKIKQSIYQSHHIYTGN